MLSLSESPRVLVALLFQSASGRPRLARRPIDKLSVVFVVLLAVLFLREPLTLKVGIGAMLITAARCSWRFDPCFVSGALRQVKNSYRSRVSNKGTVPKMHIKPTCFRTALGAASCRWG